MQKKWVRKQGMIRRMITVESYGALKMSGRENEFSSLWREKKNARTAGASLCFKGQGDGHLWWKDNGS